jgi:hypothetical protein
VSLLHDSGRPNSYPLAQPGGDDGVDFTRFVVRPAAKPLCGWRVYAEFLRFLGRGDGDGGTDEVFLPFLNFKQRSYLVRSNL